MRPKKGDKVRVGESVGTVVYVGSTSAYIDFDGFTTLLNFHRLQKVEE